MSIQVNRHVSAALVAMSVALAALVMNACDGDNTVKEPTGGTSGTSGSGTSGTGSGTSGALPDGGKDCFDNPQDHFEIINACTDARGIEKNPRLSKLLPDGGLPPLK